MIARWNSFTGTRRELKLRYDTVTCTRRKQANKTESDADVLKGSKVVHLLSIYPITPISI